MTAPLRVAVTLAIASPPLWLLALRRVDPSWQALFRTGPNRHPNRIVKSRFGV